MRHRAAILSWLPAFFLVVIFGIVFIDCAPVHAEPHQPVIKFVYPAGGQRGTTVEAIVSGTDFQGVDTVRITGTGVTASIVKVENSKTVRISAVIAADAEPGERDLRVITPAGGASNRFRFFVGELPEIVEKEPNSSITQPQPLESLPVLINGQVMPSDRDIFRITAKKGQTLVCQVQARKVLPYIADAVPGWLEACLTLYDTEGRVLASVDTFRFSPDPVLIYNVPKDGDYLLEVRDIIYRGRADFVYRLTITTSPFLNYIFPLGWKRNADAQIELHGTNLPTKSLKLTLPGDSPPIRFVRLSQNGFESNALPFAVSDYGEVQESEPNDLFEQANTLTLPVTINGRIQKPEDGDYFRFAAKKGQRFIIEVEARRLESPLDSIITLFNAQGTQLGEQDDTDFGDPLLTHHADSRLDYTFRADGDYVVRIRDVQHRGGDAYAYRLHIIPPRPNFLLRSVPDNPRLGPEGSVMITVKALRKDGFNGEIPLAVENLPQGFIASDAVIPAGQSETRLTFTAPPKVSTAMIFPTIVGIATIGDQKVVRKAVSAEYIMQAFSLHHDVPTQEFLMSVVPSLDFTLSTNIPSTQVRQVRQDGQLPVLVKASRKGLQAALAQAETQKKAADEALTKVRADLAKAKTDYQAAEKVAKDSQAAVPKARTAATQAATAAANAQKVAASKRQQANAAKKHLDELIQKQLKPTEAKLAAASKLVTDATNAKTAADKILADAKNTTAKAQQSYNAAEKAAKETATKAEATAKDAKKSDDDKKKTAADAAAKRKTADTAKAALTQAQQKQQQTQSRVDAAAKKLAEAETQKKSAEQALAAVKKSLTAATKAYEATEQSAKNVEAAAVAAKTAAQKAKEAQVTAEKTATEKRKLANDAKARQDRLVKSEKASVASANQAKKSLDAAQKKTKEGIKLTAEGLPRGFTFKGASIPADKDELTVTLSFTKQVPVGYRYNVVITGTTGSVNALVTHVTPAIPIQVLVSLKTLEAAAATKRKQANDAKKKLDNLVQKQQKPAEAKLAAATKALAAASAAKSAADKALADAKNATTKAQQTLEAAGKVAKEAATKAQTIAKDAKKTDDEKKKTSEEATAQRKAADAAKTAFASAQKKQQQTKARVDAATKTLAAAEARKKAIEQALAAVKTKLATATAAYQAADKAAKEAEAELAKAKSAT